jgi:hypothetical protein
LDLILQLLLGVATALPAVEPVANPTTGFSLNNFSNIYTSYSSE